MTNEHEAPNVQSETSEEGDYIDVTLVEETGEETDNSAQLSESDDKSKSKKRNTIIAVAGVGGAIFVAAIVILVLVFSGPKMPDLVGEKPYAAKVALAEIIDKDCIVFQTQDEIRANPENESDYSEWVVVDQSVSSGSSISDGTVTITIKPTDEYMARRERIITEFIGNQEKVYDWKEGEITYTDFGDVLIIVFKPQKSEYSDYWPIGFTFDENGSQVEADQLASALGSDVIDLAYEGDWLSLVTLGMYSQSPQSAQEKTKLLTQKIIEDGIEYSKANREKALDNFRKGEQKYDDASVKYELTDEGAYIIKVQCDKRSYTWTEGEEYDKQRQRNADSAARYLWAPVSIGYIDGDGSLYKHFDANPTLCLWDKDTGSYSKID